MTARRVLLAAALLAAGAAPPSPAFGDDAPQAVEHRRVRVTLPVAPAPGGSGTHGPATIARRALRAALARWFAAGPEVPLSTLRDGLRAAGWTAERLADALEGAVRGALEARPRTSPP